MLFVSRFGLALQCAGDDFCSFGPERRFKQCILHEIRYARERDDIAHAAMVTNVCASSAALRIALKHSHRVARSSAS